jgi:hypothetical protein
MIAPNDEILAIEGERRHAVRRHLLNEQPACGLGATNVWNAGDEDADVVGHEAERRRGVTLQPGLSVLLGGSHHRIAIG